MAMKLHTGRQHPNRFGGTTTTTLCGRTNAACSDGMNIADDDGVTCRFCLRQMEITRRLRAAKKRRSDLTDKTGEA